MRIRHLSTEELLLQCEGELGFERAAHLDECEACRTALVDLVELLGDAELELRGTVPSETAVERAAAWDAIEQRISRPAPATVIPFPVRWAGAYAAAAALGFAVFSGIVESDFFSPGEDTAPAVIAETPILQPPTPAAVPPPSVAQEAAAVEPETVAEPVEFASADAAPAVPTPVAADRKVLERYSFKQPTLTARPGDAALPLQQAPLVAALRPTRTPDVFSTDAPLMEAPVAVEETAATEPLTLAAAEKLVEGYWILHRANVWREDVTPTWTADGLVFTGTIDNERVRDEVTAAIRSVDNAGNVRIELSSRVASGNSVANAAADQVGPGALGGVVRTSLLEHYGDAARRSFASTEPSALEGELNRFVNDVFENQSSLLAHAYELKAMVHAVPAELIQQLAGSSRFTKLTAARVNAVRRHQAEIYDLLSETLPRKYWTYKSADENLSSGDLRAETEALLEDALELDANLTALLSTPQYLLDVDDADLSCGEALSRIRTRLSRIKADTAKLR